MRDKKYFEVSTLKMHTCIVLPGSAFLYILQTFACPIWCSMCKHRCQFKLQYSFVLCLQVARADLGGSTTAKQFGLSIEPTMLAVKGRVLDPPLLKHAGVCTHVYPYYCVWSQAA